MSSLALTTIRGYILSSSVTTIVPKKDVTIGYRKTIDNFPCIIITQRAGMDTGFLGYGQAGQRTRKEECLFSLDIYSRTSRKQTYDIADILVPVLIASGSCKKVGDIDMYDDSLSVYHKAQTYKYILFHSD